MRNYARTQVVPAASAVSGGEAVGEVCAAVAEPEHRWPGPGLGETDNAKRLNVGGQAESRTLYAGEAAVDDSGDEECERSANDRVRGKWAGHHQRKWHYDIARCAMTEPAGGGLVDPKIALQRQVETLAQRFPDVDHDELRERVHAAYDKLKDDATVDSHLVAMTEKQVTEDLRSSGETVHVRSDDRT
ncbi:three-helix bundle dimerization domain-containing protein [Paractinoplanes rishiriensis]|uniref:Uncharacterized protein n=1 Tax=Paractinoplanes rishiriensis TaxID=1050105 RepID=A0A919MZN3_9ACTN|nr:hypothetical protein [Actinoplanes rishiriensis]GIE98540.1 hypothetical protein Ari01nite_60050 [Actinoplanes rishiriensis]